MSEFSDLITKKSIEYYYEQLWFEIKDEKELYFFGANMGYRAASNWIHKNLANNKSIPIIKGVLNNDPNRWNTQIEGTIVLSPNTLFNEIGYCNELILIVCGAAGDIIPQLLKYGVPSERIKVFTLGRYDGIDSFKEYLYSHISEFETVYGMLSDFKSRKTFINIINFKLSGDFNLLSSVADPLEDQYFDPDLIKFDKTDIYLDCGAYNGDTVASYRKHSRNQYGNIISFEANPETYCQLLDNTREDTHVTCVNKGLWNTKGTLRFTNDKFSVANSISVDGEIVIETDTIDSIVGDQKITHIKMDIEGAEIPALIGAFDTIKKNKPSLAICVYHKNDDFITIPLLIKSICPDYKLYFRQYQKMSAQETVCYAIMR